jgi:hypothetical protein
MRAMRLAPLIFSVLVACGGGHKSPTTTLPPPTPDPIPKTAGPACAAVADQLAIVLHADQTPDQAVTAKTTEAARTRCETDKWSDEARNCLGSVQSESELDGCTKLLTDAQRTSFAALSGEPKPAAAAALAAPPAADGAAPKKPRSHTRGPVKKDKTKSGDSDPDEGGE